MMTSRLVTVGDTKTLNRAAQDISFAVRRAALLAMRRLEMHEIARTFEGVGMTPRVFEGAADIYEFVAATALGRETPESRDRSRHGKDVVRLLADPAAK